MLKGTILLAVAWVMLVSCGAASAQEAEPSPSSSSAETLTLDQATALALRNNHAVKVAELGVERADEEVSAAKTIRLLSLRASTLVSGKLARA